MGQTHAAGWAATPAEMVGVVSKNENTAVSLTKQYGGNIYPDLARMLLDVDVVDICTPTYLHHEIAMQAAAAGKHVICEKPLARTVEQAEEIMAACEAAGVKLLVAHVVRFFHDYALAKQTVAAGEVGKPTIIRLKRGSFQPQKSVSNWFLDFEKSGGVMLDLMIHDFDYARWIAGDVVHVYAKKFNSSHAGADITHGLAILTHESGAVSRVEGSWSWTYPQPIFRTQLEIAGDNGMVQFDAEQAAPIGLSQPQMGGEAQDVPLLRSPLSEDPYTTQIKSFYDHLVNDALVRITAVDGYKAVQIALAAIESAQTGQIVAIDNSE